MHTTFETTKHHSAVKEDRPFIKKDVKSLARVILDANFERAAQNQVYLSPGLFHQLFNNKEGFYVSIANKIFRASKDKTLMDKQIMLSEGNYRQITGDIIEIDRNEEVVVRPFAPNHKEVREMSRLRLCVSHGGSIHKLKEGEKPAILEESLEKLVREQCGEQILVFGQELFVMHPVIGPLKVTVDQWDYKNPIDQSIPRYGKCTKNTRMEFTANKNADFVIIKEVDHQHLSHFYFRISRVSYIAQREFDLMSENGGEVAWKVGGKPLPVILAVSELSKKIKEELGGKLAKIGDKFDVEASPEWKFDVALDKVVLKRDFHEQSLNDPVNVQRAFRLQKNHAITVIPCTDVILTEDFQNIHLADSVTFEIVDKHSEYEPGKNSFDWVSVAEVIAKIRENDEPFSFGSKRVVEVGGMTILLDARKIAGRELKRGRNNKIKPLWRLNDQTEIKLFAASGIEVQLFESNKPVPVKTMRIEVSVDSTGQGGGIFSMLFGGDKSSGPKIRIAAEDIEKVFRYALAADKLIYKNQVLTDITDKGDKVSFTIKEINTSDLEVIKAEYNQIYVIDDKTEMTLFGKKEGSLVITLKPMDINAIDVTKKLREHGIGGLSSQFKDVITKIVLSKSKYAEHTKNIGQKPPRGILLSGPPGTGKTILARKLGEILGVSPENIQLITGSNVWSKYVGDSEKKVRELFAAARSDQEVHGKHSPMHLLIIDEIDAFLQSRDRATQNYETSVLTTFLAELDGISGQGAGSLENIIVVGLTNYPEKLDAAVTRPGRLGTQIHIGIPDKEGRKEILEIHTRNIREKGFLAADFDLELIAKTTIGRTGAFIEDLVRVAASYSLKRLFEERVEADKIKGHPSSLVTTEDFMQAYDAILNKEKKMKESINAFTPSNTVTIDSLISDLKKLNIVGLPRNVVDFLYELKIRDLYRKDLVEIGHPFPKGVLLYGPAGTGKTKLVKGLKNLFGLDGLRFQYFAASQLWPLKPEALKDKIEKIIQPAKDAAADLKGEAQLHVVVIDEIDWMYWMQGEGKETRDLSIINNFMKEFDEVDLNNLLVIGVGRRTFKLPDSILSHGRFGKHIDMGYPNAAGRLEILKALLEKHLEKGIISEEILGEIVTMTKDRTPAFLEGLVGEADITWLKRGDPLIAKMTFIDFEEAYRKMTLDEPDKNYIL